MDNRDVRKRTLPLGWYPVDEKETMRVLENWEKSLEAPGIQSGMSAVVPHAGWSFSGKLAYKTLRHLNPASKIVIIAGGHMRAGDGTAVAGEQYFETPFGPMPAAEDFKKKLGEQIAIKADKSADNTVEVQLPIVRYLFPEAKVLWLRVEAGEEAIELGRVCAGIAGTLSETVSMIGSTDLTHYGPNYGFAPKGIGPEAVEWAQQENDGGIIKHMLQMQSEDVLHWGNQRKAACSPGAAVAAIEFASAYGCEEGLLTGYDSSYSLHPDSSFVGYAGIVYSNADK
ncbi:MAG: AmmeMemoRadiSam system protein B [Spirochaetia bacterium]